MRRRRMGRIDQTQLRAADTELDLIGVKQRDGSGNALSVYQRAVKALLISYGELCAAFSNLGMAAGNHRGRDVDYHFTFGIAADTRDFPLPLYPFYLAAGVVGQLAKCCSAFR